MRRLSLARPAALAAAGALSVHTARVRAEASEASSQAVARRYAEELATTDGVRYTLDYLDKSKRFSIWRGNGERSSFSEMLSVAAAHDVVLLGETHYDAIAHKLQDIMFARLAATRPSVALSLEMFEMDVQQVLDEYLQGRVREEDLLKDGRPWANYEQHYRPMVELAKAANIPVIAANAPRRYVSAVGRDGEDALTHEPLGSRAYADLPPLPLPKASSAYMASLYADPEVVPPASATTGEKAPKGGGCPYIGLKGQDGLVAPMKLWDASMAYSIARALEHGPNRLVVHICGSDHVKFFRGAKVGVSEWLHHYRPTARPLVIVMVPVADCHSFDAADHGGLGDFVVLTDDLSGNARAQEALLSARAAPTPPPPSPTPPPPTTTPRVALTAAAAPVALVEPPKSGAAPPAATSVSPAPGEVAPTGGNNSLSRAIFCLQQSALYAGGYGILVGASTYSTILALEWLDVRFSRSFLRRGGMGLPMGLGLVAACIGAKHGVAEGIEALRLAGVSV